MLADLRAACLRSASTQKPAVSVLDSRQDSTLQVAQSMITTNLRVAPAKSKCMRDHNLGDIRFARDAGRAWLDRSSQQNSPLERAGFRTLVPDRTRDPTLSKLMFPGDTERQKSEIEPGVCGAL